MSKYGSHGQAEAVPDGDVHASPVSDFLDELRERPVDWLRFVELSDAPGVDDAIELVGRAAWSGAVQNATQRAALDTFASLALRPSDFAGPLDMAEVRGMIAMAAKAIALGDGVSAEHAASLLRPFAEVGVRSATAALAARSVT